MKKKKVIIIVTVALLLLLLLCCWLSYLKVFDVKERKRLEGVTTSNIDIKALLIQDEFLGDRWKLVETDFLRSNYAQMQTVEEFTTKKYAPVSSERTSSYRGLIYQEVFKTKDAYAGRVLFVRPIIDSDQEWVEKEENFVEMEHHADEWYLSCANIHQGRRNCSLIARYTDIVVFLKASFCPEDFSQEEFLDLVKFIDETAGELGLYEP
ncbi:MAG TPA: hypothetical protein PLW45_02715 [Anaerolineaceae bacterium]|jgi:hypothetical protein|nr:hypothetical protein [Anaerolineaceae bacterium]